MQSDKNTAARYAKGFEVFDYFFVEISLGFNTTARQHKNADICQAVRLFAIGSTQQPVCGMTNEEEIPVTRQYAKSVNERRIDRFEYRDLFLCRVNFSDVNGDAGHVGLSAP